MQSAADTVKLEEMLSAPTPGVIRALGELPGDIMVLGAGGKMGPSLARMAKRASNAAGVQRRVIAVSRFTDPRILDDLKAAGVHSISADLMDEGKLGSLPEAPNIIYMAGTKFGTTGNEPQTWAMNAFLPGLACLNNSGAAYSRFGTPSVGVDQLLVMVADWVMRGGPSLGKPTHFESTDGRF